MSTALPDLSLEEVHVEVKVGVADGQETHRLHPDLPLLLIGHRDTLKTAQPIQLVLLEVAAI